MLCKSITIYHKLHSTMNLLDFLGTETTAPTQQDVSSFRHGTYITIKHNTLDVDEIKAEFGKLYRILFHRIKGVKANPRDQQTGNKFPLEKSFESSTKRALPMMVSTIERRETKKGTVFISHHYLYGAHWGINASEDAVFAADIEKLTRYYLNTVDMKGKNFLVQPVGQCDEQANDKVTDSTLFSYMKNYDLDEDEATLMSHLIGLKKPKMKYAFTYSHME